MSKTVTTPGIRVVDGRQVPPVGTWEIDPSHQSFLETGGFLLSRSVRLEIEAELVKK